MALTYCMKVELPNDHSLHCICVPIPIDPWWFLKPWPPPWIDKFEPQPDPWIIDERLNPRIVRNLTILATIAKLTEQLSPELQETLHGGIKRAVEQLQLPAEATVRF